MTYTLWLNFTSETTNNRYDNGKADHNDKNLELQIFRIVLDRAPHVIIFKVYWSPKDGKTNEWYSRGLVRNNIFPLVFQDLDENLKHLKRWT